MIIHDSYRGFGLSNPFGPLLDKTEEALDTAKAAAKKKAEEEARRLKEKLTGGSGSSTASAASSQSETDKKYQAELEARARAALSSGTFPGNVPDFGPLLALVIQLGGSDLVANWILDGKMGISAVPGQYASMVERDVALLRQNRENAERVKKLYAESDAIVAAVRAGTTPAKASTEVWGMALRTLGVTFKAYPLIAALFLTGALKGRQISTFLDQPGDEVIVRQIQAAITTLQNRWVDTAAQLTEKGQAAVAPKVVEVPTSEAQQEILKARAETASSGSGGAGLAAGLLALLAVKKFLL